MKVLIAASECSPLVKVGGIADVIGSLPIALKELGIDIRVVLPYYQPLLETVEKDKSIQIEEVAKYNIPFASTYISMSFKITQLQILRRFCLRLESIS